MIIKTQNEESIINFDTVRVFYIERRGKNYGITCDTGRDAGEYSTKEVAKQVLKEMSLAHKYNAKIFEMPIYF